MKNDDPTSWRHSEMTTGWAGPVVTCRHLSSKVVIPVVSAATKITNEKRT
jgi:hypothetical protein